LTTIKEEPQRPVIAPDRQLLPPRKPTRHRVVSVILWIVIILVFAVAFWLVLRHSNEAQSAAGGRFGQGAVTVMAGTARTGNIGLYLDTIGTVTPVHTVSIMSQVNGQVIAVHFKEGQMVKQGDPLIDIDPRPYAATLLQAQGALERDQNLLAQAQMDLERYQQAWAKNAIPKQTLDDQEKLVLQDQGTVKNDQGAVDYDQVQLEFCHITSPITGRVGLRLVDPGNIVQSSGNTVLAVVTEISPITVVFPIAEDNLDQLQSHMQDGTKLSADAYDRADQNKLDSGKLITIDNQIDTTTGTVKGRALFPNKTNRLFPNEFVNVHLLVTTLKGVTLVPAAAIQHNGDESFVYTIEDGAAHIVDVTPGVTNNGRTQVTGISPGQKVANSGFERLEDGSKVTVTTRPSTQESTPSNEAEAP
jgi:membrane fusion protein, multidrug efflux system